MTAETSEVKSKGNRSHFQGGARRRRLARGETYRRPGMDVLEARELLATLPASTFLPNTLPVSAVTGAGNMSTPSIAINQNNPQKLAAVWTRNDPQLANAPTQIVQLAVSSDGGKTWNQQGSSGAPPGGYQFPQSFDPTTTNPVILFPQYSDASVGFDRNDNFYVLYSGHKTDNSVGVLLLNKYNFSTNTAQTVFSDKEVYKWIQDSAFTPTLKVDDSVASFTDTNTVTNTNTNQSDSYTGNVYVSWTSNDVAPASNPSNFNPNRIRLVASTDGGASFSGIQSLNDNGNFGTNRPVTPQVAVSQGSAARGVNPGQVSVVWDDYGIGSKASTPYDQIYSDRIANGAVAQSFSATPGGITDAGPGTPNSPSTTSFPITVNVNDPRFLSVSNVTLNLSIVDPSIQELQIYLDPPVGSGLSSLLLMDNQIDANGTSFTFQGNTGANLGIAASGEAIGTTFDDLATRSITDFNNTGGRGAAAPFIGHFRPEGGSLNANFAGPNIVAGGVGAANSINGQWTLRVVDYRNTPSVPEFLRNATLTFTSGFMPNVDTNVATSLVRASQSGAQIASPANFGFGITAAPVIASDNTLGAYSPYQGRLYAAFADRLNIRFNPADNSEIYLSYSDDGGINWTRNFTPINDDLASRDGYSTGSLGGASPNQAGNSGRPQFQPNIAVDSDTGTLVASWYDAREDAVASRVTTYLTTSIDGGATFSKNAYANDSQTVTDAITGKKVILSAIPDNQLAAFEPISGFGTHQGLAVYGGHAYPIWSSNQNGGGDGKQPLGIRSNVMTFGAGPRVITITQGPVGEPNDTLNNSRAADGTPMASAFLLTFDRPIDPNSFTASDVQVLFRDTTAVNSTGGLVPIASVVPLNPDQFGATQFQVNFAPRSGVGTYSIAILGKSISDQVRSIRTVITPVGNSVGFASTDVPRTIGPNGMASSIVSVAGFGLNQILSNVTVTVGSISAADASSLTLTLISPTGTRILLSNHEPFVFAGGQDYTGTTFDDNAPQAINQGFAPFNSAQGYRPLGTLAALRGQTLNGNWQLEVRSSLSPLTATLNAWSLSVQAGVVSQSQVGGNKLDQNANATVGQVSDFFATPTPVNPVAGGQFTGPFLTDTQPLIVPGPHVIATSIPGAAAAADNLVLDTPVNSIDVTFDRDMNPSTVTAASVLQVMGLAGSITSPFSIQKNPQGSDPDPTHPRTYRILFPSQKISGTYIVTLASTITDARGNALDTNLNAGVDLLRGTVSGPTTTATYKSTFPTVIPDTKTVVSTINVPDNFAAQAVTVQLDITHASDPDLQITLVSPDNIPIILVARGTGTTNGKANFTSTIFDDTASTVISNGAPPFFGRFKPATPLSALNGLAVNGTWKLIVDDNPATPNSIGGRLNSWSISFQKGTPGSGLGEPVADQASASFRIFNSSPTNPLASTTWTSVGPASLVNAGSTTNNGFSGRIGALAVDPSDPSGNTVYVAGASGGVWKTGNFLTLNPNGPTYIPLTDFGPNSGIFISSITVFPRNNDPRQSIIIAGTGDSDTTFSDFNNSAYGVVSHGVGFLRSLDGGSSWTLLDSSNNNLPFAARDHLFSVGTTNGFFGTSTEIMKVVADPRPTPNGGVIVYAAVKGPFASPDGGLYRSVDTGLTWTKLSDNFLGSATDVVLDLNSATVDAVSNPTGNVNIIYAAFPGHGIYISPNRGQVLNLMAGGNVDPLIYDATAQRQVPVNGSPAPFPGVGDFSRVILARPALIPSTAPNADIQNQLYEGWLYAAVSDDLGFAVGVYLTKDYGQTWTKLQINGLYDNGLTPRRAVPSNSVFDPKYPVNNGLGFTHNSYDVSMTIDATNPNIIYLGGTANGNVSGLIRVDSTLIYDSHAVIAYNGNHSDPGAPLQINTTGSVAVDDNTKAPAAYIGTSGSAATAPGSYINLLTDPTFQFNQNSTLFVRNTASFTNDGSGVKWTTLDQMLQANGSSAVPSSNIHRMLSYVDPSTGKTRLIVGDDQGVFTGVINADGTINPGPGTAVSPTYSRNGNLAIAQLYYGASQPTTNPVVGQLDALFYGNGINVGQTASDPNVLTNGNITSNGTTDGSTLGGFATTSADQAGTGVGVGVTPTGDRLVYRYLWPAFGGNATDFLQVSTDGGPFVSRTTGLVQTANDPQWPPQSTAYAHGLIFGNFTVSPLNGNQAMISSNAGRIFMTTTAGDQWLSIGEPGSLDGSYAPALTFGAPDPKGPAGIGNLNNFLYAGTVNGNIFVTQTGGGGAGNPWTKVSTGLDGSPVVKIIANPTRGSHEVYAVTQKGVYYIQDSTIANAAWTNITGSTAVGLPGTTPSNLFLLTNNPFGQAGLNQTSLTYLTSIQADWRYVLPNDPKGLVNPTGTHPILYVSGDLGVYRSLDNGATWTVFPNASADNAPIDGGYLPNVKVSDLTIAIGQIDPTTGQAVAQPGDPNTLLATTFGRGQFMIRLAPLVFQTSLALDPKLPAPGGSSNSVDSLNRPVVTISQPVIDGLSEQSAFGNTVKITILDVTDPTNPHVIGGYDPAQGTTNNPTDVPANYTDSAGKFQVQVSPTGFTTNGVKTIGIQATDASGTKGNIATLIFVLDARLTSTTAPAAPIIALNPLDDSSGGNKITNNTSPRIIGATDPGTKVQLYLRSVNGVAQNTLIGTTLSDALGNFSIPFPQSTDGVYIIQAIATNVSNNLTTSGNLYTFTIKTSGPTIVPVLILHPADDTGAKGDGVTADRFPHFDGATDPLAQVSIFRADSGGNPIGPLLSMATADGTGKFSIQLPFALSNGPISVVVQVKDAAGNPLPPLPPLQSNALTVTIVSVPADFTLTGVTTPAVFRRAGNGTGYWFIQGVPPASGIAFGGSIVDIPFTGDFDGDGKADLALYRPSSNTWFIRRSSLGFQQFNLGAPGSIPSVADFDGDGKLDVSNYNPITGNWQLAETTGGFQTVTFNAPSVFTPQAGDVPVPGNYDGGNGPDELAVFRPSTGQFFIKGPGVGVGGTDNISIQVVAGWMPGSYPVPGNYDDSTTRHKTEPAVYNPATGTYLILGPSGVHSATFRPGDIPAPGDYLGTGQTQPAVYHLDPATNSNSFIVNSPTSKTIVYGGNGDIPVTAPLAYRTIVATAPTLALDPSSDSGFPGDNVTSIRSPFFTGQTEPGALVDLLDNNNVVVGTQQADPSGKFRIQLSPSLGLKDGTYTFQARAHGLINSQGPISPPITVKLITVKGDYTGTGSTDAALFRRLSKFDAQFFVQGVGMLNGRHFGAASLDVPIAADFYGDGQTDLVVYRPSTAQWFVEQASTGYTGVLYANFGTPNTGDVPVPADYLGSGHAVLALFRPTTGEFFVGGQAGSTMVVPGRAGDVAVPGNYDNTGRDEFAVYRPSTNQWFIKGPSTAYTIDFGGFGDVPVPGAYDASTTSQQTEVAVWRPSSGQYFIRTPGGGTRILTFAPGDIPAPGDYEGTGITEAAVFRPSTGQFFAVSPGQSTPHVLNTGVLGKPNDVPLLAPYSYRAIGSTISKASVSTITAQSVNLGSTARSLSVGGSSQSSSRVSATLTTVPQSISQPSRGRPKQVVNPVKTPTSRFASLALLLARKGHHLPG